MAGNRRGSKTVLDASVERRLIEMIRRCTPIEVACIGVGIASATYRAWRTKAREGVEPYASFFVKVEAARAEAQAILLKRQNRLARRDARANEWILEKVFSDKYGRVREMREAKRLESKEVQRGPAHVEITLKHDVADPSEVHAPAVVGARSV